MRQRIHIFGASGAGTSTLGRAVAAALGLAHLDTDDFYWEPTEPPFVRKRPVAERLTRLAAAFSAAGDAWVLSGSLAGWGDPLIPQFQLAVFLTLEPTERLQRLRMRESQRYGLARITPGGDRADAHSAFMAWAARYDDAGTEQRSRALHERWLAQLPCPVLRLDSAARPNALCRAVVEAAA